MSLRPASGEARSQLVVAAVVVAVIILTRIWLLAVPPAFSDIPAYQHDAAMWGAAGEEGTSFYDLHRAYVISTSEALGHEPPEGTTLIEYPPLALAFVAAVNVGLPSSADPQDPARLQDYLTRYRLLAFAVDLLVLVTLGLLAGRAGALRTSAPTWRWATAWRLAVFGAGGVAIYYILYDRLDIFEGALLLASLLALTRGWWAASLAVLAVAIDFKVYPAVLAPIWLVASLPASALVDWRRGAARLARLLAGRILILGGTAVALVVPFVVVQGADAFQFVAFNAQRGVQLESVGAAALMLLQVAGQPLQIIARYGAYEVVSPLTPAVAWASLPLTVVAVAVVGLLYLRRVARDLPRPEGHDPTGDPIVATCLPGLLTLATVATLMIVLLAAKVLSPQYFLWLLPLVPLLEGGRGIRVWQAGFVVLLALSTVIFPGLYSAGPLDLAIIVRDAVLVGLTIAALALLAAPGRSALDARASSASAGAGMSPAASR
jgi:hypothetical protein